MAKDSNDMGNIFSKASSTPSPSTSSSSGTSSHVFSRPLDQEEEEEDEDQGVRSTASNGPDPFMTNDDEDDEEESSIPSRTNTTGSDHEEEMDEEAEVEEEEEEEDGLRGPEIPPPSSPPDSDLRVRGIEDIARKVNPLEAGQLLMDIFRRKIRACKSQRCENILQNALLILFADGDKELDEAATFRPRKRDAACQDSTQTSPAKLLADAMTQDEGISEEMIRDFMASEAALRYLSNSSSSTSPPSATVEDDIGVRAKKRKADGNNNPSLSASSSQLSVRSVGTDASTLSEVPESSSSDKSAAFHQHHEEERTKLMNTLCQARLEVETVRNQLEEAEKEKARLEEALKMTREEAERDKATLSDANAWLEVEVNLMRERAEKAERALKAAVEVLPASSSSSSKGDGRSAERSGQDGVRVRDMSELLANNPKESLAKANPAAKVQTAKRRDMDIEIVEAIPELPTECQSCNIMLVKERQYKSHMTSDYHKEQVRKKIANGHR